MEREREGGERAIKKRGKQGNLFISHVHSILANIKSGELRYCIYCVWVSGPFLLYYLLDDGGGEEENYGGNWLIFNNWENGFPYFIYVVAIISISIVRVCLYIYGFSILSWKI